MYVHTYANCCDMEWTLWESECLCWARLPTSDHPSHFLSFYVPSVLPLYICYSLWSWYSRTTLSHAWASWEALTSFTFRSHLLHAAALTLLLVFNKHDLPYCVLLFRHVIVHPVTQQLKTTRLTAINTTHPFRLWGPRVSTPDLVKMHPCTRLLQGQEGTTLFQGKVSQAQENRRNIITFSSQPLCPSGTSAVLPSSAHPRSSCHHHTGTGQVHRAVLLAENCLSSLMQLTTQSQTVKNPQKTTFS